MDKIWRLMTAMFLLLIAIVSLLMAYILFANTALAAICVWVSFACTVWGIGKGLFAIIDYRREHNDEA